MQWQDVKPEQQLLGIKYEQGQQQHQQPVAATSEGGDRLWEDIKGEQQQQQPAEQQPQEPPDAGGEQEEDVWEDI